MTVEKGKKTWLIYYKKKKKKKKYREINNEKCKNRKKIYN